MLMLNWMTSAPPQPMAARCCPNWRWTWRMKAARWWRGCAKHCMCGAKCMPPPHDAKDALEQASFPRRRESRSIHSVQRVRALTTAPQCSTPTAHDVARTGFPPVRERQVGETHARRGLTSDGCSGLIYFKTKPYLATANHPPRPHSVIPAQAGIQGHPQRAAGTCSHHRPAMLKLPTAHAVARTGFPPARERQVGETHTRRGLTSDGCSCLISFETKPYLATANHPPHSTPSFPRRRESRGIHSVQRVRALTTAPQCSTPTAHDVARTGFPPVRERQAG